jgi:integrase
MRRNMGDQLGDRAMNQNGKLNARKVATAPPGYHLDGGGLYLCVSPSLRRSWVYRFSWKGKRPEMGLGSYDEGVSLAEARTLRDEARRVKRNGKNPVEARRAAWAAAAGTPTFGEVAEKLLEAKEKEIRSKRNLDQWKSSLRQGAARLWSQRVDEIGTAAVLETLTPLWNEKRDLASRLRGRIEAVLDAAGAQGHRTGENPARWRGHLKHLFPKRPKLTKGHHAAMRYDAVPAFLQRLRNDDSIGARALEFAILTAARTNEVLGATWQEVDLTAAVWTIPAERMKAEREHIVPLAGRALEMVEELAKARTCDAVFPSPQGPKRLSHIVMQRALARNSGDAATVHGFRSTFRDWAGDETHVAREVVEAALAHVVGDKAEQAYRRGTAVEKRRALMIAWDQHCERKEAENVVRLKQA